jgi:protoporphyrinogen oxidase
MNLILGAGLTGLSCSYHLGHESCIILEKNGHAYGHLHVETRDGYTWDEGPHVSFTKHQYVRELFAHSVSNEFDEYEVRTANYFRGHWIDHPAQSSLYQVPEPLRSACLESFLASRQVEPITRSPANYAEWLEQAFGRTFSETFPAAYTRKYWTREPRDMTTDWVGGRVFYPRVEDVIAGSKGPLGRQTHYITKVRYPRRGGYQSFVRSLADGARIRFGAEVSRIDLAARRVWTASGESFQYERLVNTLPLPLFVQLCAQATPAIIEAARALSCSQLLLVNVMAAHPTLRTENWMYVYDEDKYSTRINCTEKLTAGNGPAECTGVQVETYFSRHRPLGATPEAVRKKVEQETIEMGLVDPGRSHSAIQSFTAYVPWANVIFDHQTRPALDVIWNWLEGLGMYREIFDLDPLTDWTKSISVTTGPVVMAGRFAQWKYFWTDDCVLRGREISGEQPV